MALAILPLSLYIESEYYPLNVSASDHLVFDLSRFISILSDKNMHNDNHTSYAMLDLVEFQQSID